MAKYCELPEEAQAFIAFLIDNWLDEHAPYASRREAHSSIIALLEDGKAYFVVHDCQCNLSLDPDCAS